MSTPSSAVEELLKLKAGAYQIGISSPDTSLIREIEKPEISVPHSPAPRYRERARKETIRKAGEELVARDRRTEWGFPSEDSAADRPFWCRHHLYMLETAFRRDLHEEGAILRFAGEIENRAAISRGFTSMTFADIKAVGP